MTVQASSALPAIARAALMFGIHISLVVLVTENAFKDRIVGGIDMAVITVIPFFPMRARIDREVLRIVVPVSRSPRCRRVTGLAICREISRGMIRAGGGIIGALMARETQRRGRYITSRVAGNTHESDVSARQGEISRAVVETRRRPCRRRVTFSAQVRETVGNVIGISHRGKVALVAAITVCRSVRVSRRVTSNAL